jgi:16S rRNA (cytidine1402-2'-O)-methyltransferase
MPGRAATRLRVGRPPQATTTPQRHPSCPMNSLPPADGSPTAHTGPVSTAEPVDARAGAPPGTLWLMPNTLDLGAEAVPLDEVLPLGVIRRAATLLDWVVEDARSARAFLKRVDAVVPLARPLQALAIHELPRARKGSGEAVPADAWKALLAPALAGRDLGLLSEAGLPAVADPGSVLVAAAHATGISVRPLAGASSLLLALAASGLEGQRFCFHGYLPQDPAARESALRALEAASRRDGAAQLCIETPYRNIAWLDAALACLGPQTLLSVSCGLTLPNGFTRTDTVAAWRDRPTALPERTPAVFILQAGPAVASPTRSPGVAQAPPKRVGNPRR